MHTGRKNGYRFLKPVFESSFCATRKRGKTLKKDFKYRFVFCYLLKIAVIAGAFAKYAVGIPIS